LKIHDERTPLMTAGGQRMLRRLREHPDAPQFNYATGDRLRQEDLPLIERFRMDLHSFRGARVIEPPPWIVDRLTSQWDEVPFFRQWNVTSSNLARDWHEIPTTSRRDLAERPWDFVPDDVPLDRLIIYRTAGTTGHPISVPHHPLAVRCYEPLIEFALERHGVVPNFEAASVACLLVGAQIRTYTYAAVLYNWQGAGFAKLNLRATEWPREGSPQRYFTDMAPQFLTGDPISFSEMMRQQIDASPHALVTTSVAMSPNLKSRLQSQYKAPVIDWYSMVETGPLGYACPHGNGYHLLPHDVHVEVLRPDGSPANLGECGEITVSGGRNIFAPLVRYRTGDFGRLELAPCQCGDAMPRLLDLEGRQPLLIRSADGTPVTTVDLSRLLREFPLMLHEFIQHADGSCELLARTIPGAHIDVTELAEALRRVLGGLPLEIRFDPALGDRSEGKAMPYRSELMLED
jgi:phenylacetate-CoA ligase